MDNSIFTNREEFIFKHFGYFKNELGKIELKELSNEGKKKKESDDIYVKTLDYTKNKKEQIMQMINEGTEEAKKIRKRENEKHKKCVILGKTSSGKSSFINGLIGETVLPADYGQATKSIISIQQSCDGTNYLLYNGERKSIEELEDLNESSTITDKIELYFTKSNESTNFLDDLIIFDTPGIEANKDIDEKVSEICKDADIIIKLVNSKSGTENNEKTTLTTINTEFTSLNVFIVFNFWDKIMKNKRYDGTKMLVNRKWAMDFLIKDLQIDLDDAKENIHFISAKKDIKYIKEANCEQKNCCHMFDDMRREIVKQLHDNMKADKKIIKIIRKIYENIRSFMNEFDDNGRILFLPDKETERIEEIVKNSFNLFIQAIIKVVRFKPISLSDDNSNLFIGEVVENPNLCTSGSDNEELDCRSTVGLMERTEDLEDAKHFTPGIINLAFANTESNLDLADDKYEEYPDNLNSKISTYFSNIDKGNNFNIKDYFINKMKQHLNNAKINEINENFQTIFKDLEVILNHDFLHLNKTNTGEFDAKTISIEEGINCERIELIKLIYFLCFIDSKDKLIDKEPKILRLIAKIKELNVTNDTHLDSSDSLIDSNSKETEENLFDLAELFEFISKIYIVGFIDETSELNLIKYLISKIKFVKWENLPKSDSELRIYFINKLNTCKEKHCGICLIKYVHLYVSEGTNKCLDLDLVEKFLKKIKQISEDLTIVFEKVHGMFKIQKNYTIYISEDFKKELHKNHDIFLLEMFGSLMNYILKKYPKVKGNEKEWSFRIGIIKRWLLNFYKDWISKRNNIDFSQITKLCLEINYIIINGMIGSITTGTTLSIIAAPIAIVIEEAAVVAGIIAGITGGASASSTTTNIILNQPFLLWWREEKNLIKSIIIPDDIRDKLVYYIDNTDIMVLRRILSELDLAINEILNLMTSPNPGYE